MRPQSQRRRLRRQRIKVNREHHAAAQLVAHPGRDHHCPALSATGRCLHSHRPIQTHRDLVGKVLVPVVRADASAEHADPWSNPSATRPGDANRIQLLQAIGFRVRAPCGGLRCPIE